MGVTNIDGVSGTRSASYTYDSLGNVTSFTDPNYATTTREYDILGRINRIALDNGEEMCIITMTQQTAFRIPT